MKLSQLILPAFMLTVSSLLFSCKEKKESTDIIIKKPVKETVKRGTQKMEDSSSTTTVNWVGSSYTVDVHRTADTSLPVVDDGTGAKYYDNNIQVRIIRKDGSEFFNRTFTKKDFAAYLDKVFMGNSVLQAIVCIKAEGDNVVFSVSIGSPDAMSDEYVPLSLYVSRMGVVKVVKEVATAGGDSDFDAVDDDEIIEE